MIDLAAKSGANVVRGIGATALGEQDARAEALRQATATARANGEAMAAALGMRVVRVLEAETSPTPAPALAFADGTGRHGKNGKNNVPTPVEAASIEIHTKVVVTLEVAP